MKKFNEKKLQPTSKFFEQLLAKDREDFDDHIKKINIKKRKIAGIMERYNEAVNLQGCSINLGESFNFSQEIFLKLLIRVDLESHRESEKSFTPKSMKMNKNDLNVTKIVLTRNFFKEKSCKFYTQMRPCSEK